jgi:hypothetical protein
LQKLGQPLGGISGDHLAAQAETKFWEGLQIGHQDLATGDGV